MPWLHDESQAGLQHLHDATQATSALQPRREKRSSAPLFVRRGGNRSTQRIFNSQRTEPAAQRPAPYFGSFKIQDMTRKKTAHLHKVQENKKHEEYQGKSVQGERTEGQKNVFNFLLFFSLHQHYPTYRGEASRRGRASCANPKEISKYKNPLLPKKSLGARNARSSSGVRELGVGIGNRREGFGLHKARATLHTGEKEKTSMHLDRR